MSGLLRVCGRGFVAGAVFEKRDGEWILVQCAPILGWMKGKPIRAIKDRLSQMGAAVEWL